MVKRAQKIILGFITCSLLFLGGCSSWLTPQPISPVLQPYIAKAPPAETTILDKSLNLGMVWLKPSQDSKMLPEREKDRILAQIRDHFSEPGIPLQVSSVEEIAFSDMSSLQQYGRQQGLTHILVVAPTVQETIVPEKFGAPRGNWLGTRTESYVFLEAVAFKLETGSPIFHAQGNGQAALEMLENGAFGPFPRIYHGFNPPGYGSVYYPEGIKEEFPPGEVHVVASKKALARLLGELDLVTISQPS